jgi:tetratricopeptide (TPR) repeat protein
VQDRITSSVVATISPRILSAEIARAQAKPTDNLSAYDLYLRAIAISSEPTESSINQALELLHRAIAADPLFSYAHGFVASAHWTRVINGWGSIAEAKARGYEAAKLAVEIGKDDPAALTHAGFGIAFLGGRVAEGLAHIERALTLNPNSLVAWRIGGSAYWKISQHEKSIQYYERALQLSPLDIKAFESYLGISFPYFFLGRYDQALNWVERALREKPRLVPALIVKIAALAMGGSDPDELRDTVQQVKSLDPGASIATMMPRLIVSRASDRELFETALRKAGFPE